MTYDEAKKALAETSDIQLRDVLLAALREIDYLRGYTVTLQQRLSAAERSVAALTGASIALKQRLDVLEDAATAP